MTDDIKALEKEVKKTKRLANEQASIQASREYLASNHY
jgi:hypothetical protein